MESTTDAEAPSLACWYRANDVIVKPSGLPIDFSMIGACSRFCSETKAEVESIQAVNTGP